MFVMARRLNATVFLTCKEGDTVAEVKKMLSGVFLKQGGRGHPPLPGYRRER